MEAEEVVQKESKKLSEPENLADDPLILPQNPTLSDFQEYVIKLKKIRGFKDVKNNALILLFNEVGELGQEMVRTWGNEEMTEESRQKIALEMADIFIYLLDLANQHDISLEQGFRDKEKINKLRIWKKHHRA